VRRGSAMVYVRGANGWVPQAKLLASIRIEGDLFGTSVAVRSDLAAAGATGTDGGGSDAGSVTVFRRGGSFWLLDALLTPSDPVATGKFGTSVWLDGSVLFVGAPRNDAPSASNAGAVYVFRRLTPGWTQEAKLTAPDAAPGDEFGAALAVNGDVLVVGAKSDDDRGTDSGSVHVFRNIGGQWTWEAKLTDALGRANDRLGSSVAVDDGLIAAGVPDRDEIALDDGAVVLYGWDGAQWSMLDRVLPPVQATADRYGFSVALSGGLLVAGAPRVDLARTNAGAVFLHPVAGADCNENGVVDTCDIAATPGLDCLNGNGVLDACEAGFAGNDADGDGVHDACDLCPGADDALDEDGDGVPDGCDVCPGFDDGADCDRDGTPDGCEIASCLGDLACFDCNGNQIPDGCDIADATSTDLNGNGVPDECDECVFDEDCDDSVNCTVDSCFDGVCVRSAQAALCDDGSACTDDSCDPTDGCLNPINFDPAIECCNPSTGAIVTVADSNACTQDLCDAGTGAVTHPSSAAGTACNDADGCTSGDQCDGAGNCSGTEIPGCVRCTGDVQCNDFVACTLDRCIDGACENSDNCPDDGVFCNGEETCNFTTGLCQSSGNPCPGICTEAKGCPCETPTATSPGCRYLGIRPVPIDSGAPFRLLVESPDFACLSKYVGYLALQRYVS